MYPGPSSWLDLGITVIPSSLDTLRFSNKGIGLKRVNLTNSIPGSHTDPIFEVPSGRQWEEGSTPEVGIKAPRGSPVRDPSTSLNICSCSHCQ